MRVGIKNIIFCFRLSLFHRKRKKQFEYVVKKKAKALESEISLFSKFPWCNFPTNGSRSFSFPSNKLKLKYVIIEISMY